MQQFLFYQHNVQQFFLRHITRFHGIVVPLSIATAFRDGTNGFLRAVCAKDTTKAFLIDPRTPLFQHKWDRKNVRDPHKRMASVFGEPFTTHGLETAIGPENLDDETLKRVTNACIKYQGEFAQHEPEQKRKHEKYAKLAGLADLPPIANPQIFIPPYFMFTTIGDPWHEAMMQCATYACVSREPAMLRPVLHFSRFSVGMDWSAVAQRLADLGIRSAFLYPNNFKEHEVGCDVLREYVTAVENLTARGIEPYALHGGYFAIMLSKVGLLGFANGVGYGEWRNSNYHKGGTAERRIYIPKLHRFLEPAKASDLINKNPDHFTSDSDLLSECVAANRPLSDVTQEEALDHFMECREQELEFVANNDIEQICAVLKETIKILEGMGEVEKKSYGESLGAWSESAVFE